MNRSYGAPTRALEGQLKSRLGSFTAFRASRENRAVMLAVCAACASAHRRVDAPGRALTPGAPSKLPDGWVHEPVTAAMDPASPFGYYVLRPTNASAHPPPLLIHLSDQAQSGPGTVASLERLLRVGPAKLPEGCRLAASMCAWARQIRD